MNIKKIVYSLILLTIFSFAAGGLILKSNIQTHEINEERTLGMENATRLEIEIKGENVTVKTLDSEEIRAVLHGTVESHGSNFVKLVAYKTGQTMRVETKRPLRFISLGERESLDLDIFIPKNYQHELVLNEISGNTRIKDLKLRSFDFTTISGDLSGDNISAEMKLDSVSGDLNLGKSKGKVRANTISGKINIDYATFENPVSAETVSGDITLKLPGGSCFDLIFETVSGKLNTDFSLNGLFKNSEEQIAGSYCNGGNTKAAGKNKCRNCVGES